MQEPIVLPTRQVFATKNIEKGCKFSPDSLIEKTVAERDCPADGLKTASIASERKVKRDIHNGDCIKSSDLIAPEIVSVYSPNRLDVCTAISPNGEILASACNSNRIKLWKLKSGALLKELPTDPASRFGPINALKFSPDSKTLASCHTRDQSLATEKIRHSQQ